LSILIARFHCTTEILYNCRHQNMNGVLGGLCGCARSGGSHPGACLQRGSLAFLLFLDLTTKVPGGKCKADELGKTNPFKLSLSQHCKLLIINHHVTFAISFSLDNFSILDSWRVGFCESSYIDSISFFDPSEMEHQGSCDQTSS
jgi:hypothetical protein